MKLHGSSEFPEQDEPTPSPKRYHSGFGPEMSRWAEIQVYIINVKIFRSFLEYVYYSNEKKALLGVVAAAASIVVV